jgi:hypothetical protein
MKGLSATFTTIGVLCIVMAIFTVVDISPAFFESIMEFSDVAITTIFWFAVSFIMILTGIAYGVLTREL